MSKVESSPRSRTRSLMKRHQSVFAIDVPKQASLPEFLVALEQDVLHLINEDKLVPEDQVAKEVAWFFRGLGLHEVYFRSQSPERIADHVLALFASKLLAATNGSSETSLALRLRQEGESEALYIVPSLPGTDSSPSEVVEHRIEAFYLDEGYETLSKKEDIPLFIQQKTNEKFSYRCAIYRTSGTVSASTDTKLRVMSVQKGNFDFTDPECSDLLKVTDPVTYSTLTEHDKDVLQEMLKQALSQLGPVIKLDCETCDSNERRILIAYRAGSAHSMLSGLTLLYHDLGLHSVRKFVEPFGNGIILHSLYLACEKNLDATMKQLAEEVSLLYSLPRTSITSLVKARLLTKPQECYAYSMWKLAYHFLSSFGVDLSQMEGLSQTVISKLREGLRKEALTEERVRLTIENYTDIIKILYKDFVARLSPYLPREEKAKEDARKEEIRQQILRTVSSELDARILNAICDLNGYILKTNFFKRSKVALSFRLNPAFLSSHEYPVRPYAIFFIAGAEFRGFHVRFQDIARGGIRIIQSRNSAAFSHNVSTVFDENYNLARTQQSKNKDIPEGGSKGTILLALDHQDKQVVAFRKYVDALLDLLLPHTEVADRYGVPEILFLGPDEGTADVMGWASIHARQRGYSYWKSFTTGKPPAMGGIPHDKFGMTTRSVHTYVMGILNKLGIDETQIKKFQTGGPDGDLGSNEILISHDKTVGIVDGAGVLYDPEGIHREELRKLASQRKPCSFFDKSKLSPQGFLITVEEHNVTLPNGRVVESGLLFRNNFHLEPDLLRNVELFVPCGGRPAAVNGSNVHLLYDEARSTPRFKYIVEGANLFFTQDARLKMEQWGVVLIKDASANKGGVTSSSLEVLAALSLSDEEFEKHMQVTDPANPPQFYQKYVIDVQNIIQDRASLEFEALWKEHQKTKKPMCEITDDLSNTINELTDRISRSTLWKNQKLRASVVSKAICPSLVELVGINNIMERVPEAYLQAIFGSYIACRFIYTRGLGSGSEIDFFEFMTEYIGQANSN